MQEINFINQIFENKLTLKICEEWINSGNNINHQNQFGYTILMNACSQDKPLLKSIKVLVENGADINHQDEIGNTALMGASENGHLEIVKYLVEKGAKINIRDFNGCTALMWASWNGHLEVVKFLIDKGAIYDTSKIINGLMKYININEEEVTKLINYIIEKNNKTFSNL